MDKFGKEGGYEEYMNMRNAQVPTSKMGDASHFLSCFYIQRHGESCCLNLKMSKKESLGERRFGHFLIFIEILSQ